MMDEELVIGKKSWNRMSEALILEGFRDGAEAGKEQALQQGFNSGFNEGFANTLALGELEGTMKVLAFNKIKGSENFSSSKLPVFKDCVICKNPEIDVNGIPFIIKEQSDVCKFLLQSKLNDSAGLLSELHLKIPSDTPPSSSLPSDQRN